MDERGEMEGLDVRVLKPRGCQGAGSRQRHRFSKLYINLSLQSKILIAKPTKH